MYNIIKLTVIPDDTRRISTVFPDLFKYYIKIPILYRNYIYDINLELLHFKYNDKS